MEAIRDFFEDVYDWLVDHSTGVVGVVCAVLLGFAGFSVYGMFAAKDASAIEQADNDAKISELQDQVKKLESNAQDADADVSTKQHFATESGQLVAEAQTKLISSDATSSGTLDDTSSLVSDAATKFANPDDAAKVWFGPVSASANMYAWSFSTTYSFAQSTQDVLWVCHLGSSTDALAIATATYDVDTDTFSDVDVTICAAGRDALAQSARVSS